jgi:hypothetical protein
VKRLIALLLTVGLAAPACVTTHGARLQTRGQTVAAGVDRDVLVEFARALPAGARVRASLTNDRTVRGTILKTTDTTIFIQPRARVPEPVAEIPLTELIALEQETPGSGVGKAVAIGAIAGAGAALATILILVALLGD